ncbi:MAG: tetratricopeptide repeat protein [Ardenticatenaceae bacterium]|nr:tetratricopeptide repeat protein [Ardenticatenaceae bacterium]
MNIADHNWLITLISRHFSADDRETLCHTLHVDPESIACDAANLVTELARQGRLQELITYCKSERPRIEWTPPRRKFPFDRNHAFTGREALLTQLETSLRQGGTAAVTQSISGMGGVGKTQLALEYAYRHEDEYAMIGWLRADSAETLAADYVALGRRLDLAVDAMPEQTAQIALVRQWLESANEAWLLVFDNVDTLLPNDLRPYLPQRQRGHIFITSRSPDWHSLGRVLSLDVFMEEEAAAFWAQRLGIVDQQEAAGKLAEDLGRLPLAMEHAAAYVGAKGCTLAHYRHLLATMRQKLWAEAPPPYAYHEATIVTTWQVAFKEIRKEPTALALFNLCCFLAPEAIPLALLRDHAAALPPELAAAAGDALALDEAIAMLRRYALAARDGDTLAVHRLVQSAARDRMTPELARQWAEAAIHMVEDVFPEDPNTLHAWEDGPRLLPQVLAAVEQAVIYEAVPETTAFLCNQAGFYLQEMGNYPAARPYYDRALAIDEKALGPDHPGLATDLNNLGMLLKEMGDLQGARPYLDRALAIKEKALGSDHPSIATGLNNLGLLLQEMGDLQGARQHLQRALAIFTDRLGPNHPNTQTVRRNLAGVEAQINQSS